MAIRPVPMGGQPDRVKIVREGEKPPVVHELTESPEGDERLKRGSTSALIGGDLTLESRGYSEATAGIINRLPQGTKNMLGI